MPSNWDEIKLGKIADFRNGLNFTKESFGKGVKVIGVKDFQDYSAPRYDEIEEINPDGVVKESDLLKQGDILFVRSNGNRQLIGRSLFINKVDAPISHSAFTIRVRLTSTNTDPKYYAFLFRSRLIRDVLSAYGGGTNISNLNQQILNGLIVPIPPLPTQRRIAEILSAYDDLIENNNRRIRILKNMAQAIYHEWFGKVDIESLPEGWEMKKLGELINFAKGKKPKETFANGDFPLLLIDSIQNGITEFTNDTNMVIAEVDDVVMVMDGASSGKVFLGQYGAVGSTLGRYRPKNRDEFSHYHFYHFILENLNQITDNNIGSAIPHANKDFINQLDVYLPPSEIEKQFHNQMKPIFDLISTLQKKNANLRQTRDLLLPRLVSGEIAVHE